MKKTVMTIAAALLIFALAISAVSFAADYRAFQTRGQTTVANPQTNQTQVPGACYGKGKKFQVWADALGISANEFASLRASGKTIAEIAKEKGLSVDDVINKVLESDKQYLDSLVKQGKLTQDQEDAILKLRKERLTERVNSQPGKPSWAGKGNGFNRGNCGGAGCQGACGGYQAPSGI